MRCNRKMNKFKKEFVTNNFKETQKLGELLAEEILASQRLSLEGSKKISEAQPRNAFRGAFVICMDGELGAGKTTFTQGLLKGLGAKGPYTSPTFLIMKEYEIKSKVESLKSKVRNVYHIDAYRVDENDLLNLGWEEIVADEGNIVIIEWPERVKKILPEKVLRIRFEGLDEERRKITFENS